MNPIGELIDPKISRVISVLAANREEFFHLQKLSNKSDVPTSTTFRIMKKLVKLDFVEVTVVDNFKIYRFARNRRALELERMFAMSKGRDGRSGDGKGGDAPGQIRAKMNAPDYKRRKK